MLKSNRAKCSGVESWPPGGKIPLEFSFFGGSQIKLLFLVLVTWFFVVILLLLVSRFSVVNRLSTILKCQSIFWDVI